MAEQIKILFGIGTPGGSRNIFRLGSPFPLRGGEVGGNFALCAVRGEGDSMRPPPNYFGHLFICYMS